jgi:hypothetical protein
MVTPARVFARAGVIETGDTIMKTWALIGSGAVLTVGGAVLVALSFTGGRDHENTQVVENSKPPGVVAPTSAPVRRSEPLTIRPPDRTHEIELARRQLDQEEDVGAKASVSSEEPLEPADLKSRLRLAINNAERDKDLSKLRELLSQLTREDADVVAILNEEYKRSQGDVPRATIVINALKAMGSAQAAEVLRGIALDPGKDSFTLGPQAANAYVSLTSNPDEIAKLFGSEVQNVWAVAGNALSGKPLTGNVVNAVKPLLESDRAKAHIIAADVFGDDAAPTTAPEKVALLLNAVDRLDRLSDGDKSFDPRTPLTQSEMALASYTESLGKMIGAKEVLFRMLGGATGLQRKIVVVSLAHRKDVSVKDEVLRLAASDQDAGIRQMACSALYYVVTEVDMPVLEKIASSDPLERKRFDQKLGREVEYYPIRDTAKSVLAYIKNQKK